MNGDERFRQAFRELREEDARRVPPFARVSRAPRPAPALRWLPLAAAAALVVALGLGALLLPKLNRPAEVDPAQWAALTEWRATTDTLLSEPETPWGGPLGSATDALTDPSRLNSQ